jgi:epsilon-lactone hydrolase
MNEQTHVCSSEGNGDAPMSAEQRENLEAVLRRSAIPVGSSVSEQRRLLRERASARPAPADVNVIPAELGGVPAADITIGGIEARRVVA